LFGGRGRVVGEGFAIPAATVQDVDLSAADTALAAEIRRLGDLMERGEETPEEFSRLVRLLVEAGQPAKAEYLLRRNWEVAAGELALYRELFGTAKSDEFAAAVESFTGQFGVGLESVGSAGFLRAAYRLRPGPPRSDAFALLAEPCEVRFDYAEPDFVAADVSSETDARYLLLRWVRGVWELAE
jgi:hypothetical protein